MRPSGGYISRVSITSFVARPLLAGMFVYGGLDAVRNPAGKVPRAEKVAPDIADLVGIDADTEQLVGRTFVGGFFSDRGSQ